MPRLSLAKIRERLESMEEAEKRTLRLQNGLVVLIESEGGDLANYHAVIPNYDGKSSIWSYTGEIDGLMALVSEYRKYVAPSRRKKP